jgi:hypothetical protein
MVDDTDKPLSPQQTISPPQAYRNWASALPPKQGLYDPELEKDACGVGFTWYPIPLLGANGQSHQRQVQPQNCQRWYTPPRDL